LESLRDDPTPHLELNINSNIGVKPALVDKMIEHVNYLTDNKAIKRFKLYTSIDTWGPRAEYVRTGLDLDIWERNLDAYLKGTGQPISFMITFNILCVTTFKSLLEKILEWRGIYNQYNKTDQPQMVRFDTPYLRDPLQYDMNLLPKAEFMSFMKESLEFMKDNVDDSASNKFTTVEYEKFKRVVDYMETTDLSPEKLIEGRKDFYNWFNTLDNRRETNFIKNFQEMEDFYKLCESINEQSK
jgi:hypothetical protein